MARIIGSIATSHTPTIGFAHDFKSKDDPVWGPIFAAYEPIKAWINEKKPDVFFVIYNDHITSFFFDHYSAFALGIGNDYAVADEGGGARDLPPLKGQAALAQHIGASLMAEEFDMSFFQNRALDHGCFSPLSMFAPRDNGAWTVPVIPLQVGVLQFPVPSALRCWKLGQALRRAIESYPEDLKVVIIATGGLSHQVHGERAGFNNTAWDMEFLDLFEKDPEKLTKLTHADYATRGGMEGSEVIMWLIMRGAMNARVKKLHQTHYLPSMTSIATAVYENAEDVTPSPEAIAAQRQQIGYQLAGAEKLEGTYPYTLQRSVKAHRINRFLHDLVYPAHREAFLADEDAEYEKAGLSPEERDLIRRRDWRGLIHYGAIFFVLEKLGAVTGVSNLHIYAAMRGQSLEDFQKTRNAPGALYSVAGKAAGQQSWDQPAKS
ncbi:gallate dioxygenase [Ferrovibrio terrae]|uniref:gallate dioxygenase n=1 Tax=Ferrovibrio terrae TaxID=2594003 RepID=UPI0031380D20